jgi:hypothetical protein
MGTAPIRMPLSTGAVSSAFVAYVSSSELCGTAGTAVGRAVSHRLRLAFACANLACRSTRPYPLVLRASAMVLPGKGPQVLYS